MQNNGGYRRNTLSINCCIIIFLSNILLMRHCIIVMYPDNAGKTHECSCRPFINQFKTDE